MDEATKGMSMKVIAVLVAMGALILQVFVPAVLDMVMSLVMLGAGGYIGYLIGKK